MNDTLLGHKEIQLFFEKVIQNGTISHAYCFVGPDHVGKTTMAEALAAKLLQTIPERLSLQSEFHSVSQEKNEKTDKTKKNIDIGQIRNLQYKLQKTSVGGGYAVAIIHEAEKMNLSAANALLKTLEEPRAKTVLILVTKNEEALPETIRSRCQMLYFSPVASSVLETFLSTTGVSESDRSEMLTFSHGLPGLVIEWSRDLEKFQEYKEARQKFLSLFATPFFAKRQALEKSFGDKTDHIEARENLVSMLELWEKTVSEILHEKKIADEKLLVPIYDRILEAKEMLTENIHPRLLIEQILIAIP